MESMQQNMEAALRSIADNTHRGINPGGHAANQYSSFKDFMDTCPPIFKEAEVLKTEYAAHQLQGPAGMWWKHHRTTFPPHAHITWREFIEAFRGVYIPLV
jgi:hypothetical protein